MSLFLSSALFASTLVSGMSIKTRQSDTVATVSLDKQTGTPKHLASGFIYGIPDAPDQIPDHFYTDIGFRYGRAGGAQLDAPARGWIWNEYEGRLNSTLSNYNTCRKYNADFIILPHDIWGTDHANSSTVWPGDDGNWTDYDNYIQTLLSDLKKYSALEGMVFDIWNEPEGSFFWQRSQQQWLDLYVRTHKAIRYYFMIRAIVEASLTNPSANPDYDIIQITGPSTAGQPIEGYSWFTNWLSTIAGNNTIPDQYSYHLEGDINSPDDDLQTTNASLNALLQQYNLPQRQVNINEYATSDEQRPAGAAWWISRLERYDTLGLRGNWLSSTTLHDLMANLLTKAGNPEDYAATDYLPTGEWQVYAYYNQNMTGQRVATTGSSDRLFDVYATTDGKTLKILAGSRIKAGTWSIQVEGLQSDGNVDVQQWTFPGTSQYSVLEAPVDGGMSTATIQNGVLTLDVKTDNTTAYAYEVALS